MIDNESDAVLASFVIKASDGTEWTFNNQDTPPHYHSGVTIDGYQPNIFDGTPVFTVKSAVGFIKKCN